jgi:hypothetical protein
MKAKKIVNKLLEDTMGADGTDSYRRTITVGEILNVLPEPVVDEIMRVLNSGDPLDAGPQLKQLLRPHQRELDAIGIVADYAAYALIYAASQSGGS